MLRRKFLQQSALASAGLVLAKYGAGQKEDVLFPVVRTTAGDRKFVSAAVENAIATVQKNIGNKELAWLFGNCFPNTLDTTVDFEMKDGRPDTYVITGDIDAMWQRDSTAQVWPYLSLIKADKPLQQMIAGVINRQTKNMIKDPYANAFYKDETKESEWKEDLTKMQPGIHERKWEIDSLCYPLRLAYSYWKRTNDISVFDKQWHQAAQLIVQTFKEQQRKTGNGPYTFQRRTSWATDGVAMAGYGYPVKPNGLICSSFRPSDDATVFSYLIPANFFAVVSLKQMAEIINTIYKDAKLAVECASLSTEISTALQQNAVINHPVRGKVYAYEVNGYGSYNVMDDANVPSLLSLPYLNAINANEAIYQNTRKLLLSQENPFFFKGKAGEGIGGPHVGADMIWPISITMRALTSNNPLEIKQCLTMLQRTHAGTGFMHESFHKNDPTNFTRKWFAWANTLFGELIWKTYQTNKGLLA